MRLSRHHREPEGRSAEANSGLWGAQACLIGGVIVYLGLAALSIY